MFLICFQNVFFLNKYNLCQDRAKCAQATSRNILMQEIGKILGENRGKYEKRAKGF